MRFRTADSAAPSPHRWSGAMAWLRTLAYVLFACTATLSSMYCLLAYIPVTYFAFIKAPFQEWMPAFARLQSYLFALTFAGVALSLLIEHRRSDARRLVLEFVALGAGTSAYLIWAQPVQRAANNSSSFVWSLAFLMPVIYLGAIEYRAHRAKLRRVGAPSRFISLSRVVAAAVFVSVLCPGSAYLRYLATGMMTVLPKGEILAWVWAAITHTLLFIFAFSAIELTTHLANRSANPGHARFVWRTWLTWLAVSFALYKVILASIPFQAMEGKVYAAILSLAGVTFVGGGLLRLRNLQASEPAIDTPATDRGRYAASILVLVAASVTVPALIGVKDWNSILEKTWSMAFWAMAAAVLVYMRPQNRRARPGWAVCALAVISLFAYRAGLTLEDKWPKALLPKDLEASALLQRHSEFDHSFEAAAMLMAPSGEERYCNRQCEFVRQQTNIPASASLNLQEINLVENLHPAIGKRPNIFIIVVDSLRQDYLSAYNPAVSFTPAIGSFAKESVVFRNAFTRYSGTTLAEPSIWSGTLQLHKHFVQPFHRVNNLEKLTQVDGYQSFVTVDTVLDVLLQPQADRVKLDEGAAKWNDVDFCTTVTEATSKIDAVHVPGKPIFLYTQPQNIHLLTLGKTAALRPSLKAYPGFAKQYASELERLDGCFGDFVKALKTRGLFENSIIVLTSDHGESLQGTRAQIHGFSLKPEVIRIPLIVHVPPQLISRKYYDAEAVTFNTDITPTLYELLDHGPVTPRPEFGRPLFTKSAQEMKTYLRDSYLVASSYLPLYGVLYNQGKELFLEDESRGVEEWLGNADVAQGANAVTGEKRRNGEAEIHADLQGLARLYGFQYKPPTLLEWLMR